MPIHQPVLTDHSFHRFVNELLAAPAALAFIKKIQKQNPYPLNLLFYIIWTAKTQQGRIPKIYFSSLFSVSYNWRTAVIHALKDLLELTQRSYLKSREQVLRTIEAEINQAEIAERQLLIEAQIPLRSLKRTELQCLNDACFNIINYFKFLGIPAQNQEHDLVTELLGAVFASIPLLEVKRIFKFLFENSRANVLNLTQLRLENV